MERKHLLPGIILFFLLGVSGLNYATTYYSRANTAWNLASTWSTVACGGVASASAPIAGDDVIICSGYTVIINTAASCQSLSLSGTVNWTSAATLAVGAGGINIHSGGDITGSASGALTTTGGLTLNSDLTSTTVTIRTITNPSQIINGTGSLARLDISTNTINNGAINVKSLLSSTTASTLTQAPGAVLTYTGAAAIAPAIDATATGNTFIYNGANQTIKTTTYYNLTISGSGTKTLGGAITVNGNLLLNAGTLATSTYQITGNASGSMTMDAGTLFYVGSNSSATNVSFPTNFVKANIHLSTASTVNYYGNNAQTISSTPDYGNLTLQTFSGIKAANGDIVVNSNLIVSNSTTLGMTSYTLTVAENYTGNGRLSFTSGIFNIAGDFTNTGTFTCGTGTVNYNGALAQTVRGVNYNNLTFSNVGDKLLQTSATIDITATFTRGTMTVIPQTGNTVRFSGTSMAMTGAATTFINLTVTGGTLTVPHDFIVNGNLVTTSPGILAMTSNTLTVSGTYSSSGGLSFTSGIFNIAGNFTNTGTFTCGTGTVNYNGDSPQTVRGVVYNNLTFSGSGAKTLQASNTITIENTFTRGNMTVTPGSNNRVTFTGASPVMTGIATTFTNLTISGGTLTAPDNFTVNATLTTTTPGILAMTSDTLNVTRTYGGTGGVSFTSGTFNLAGAFSNTGTFTCGTGTMHYNGNAGQTIRGVQYHNLTFSGTGAKTLQASATIQIAGTFNRSTMTVSTGTNNTVEFNGTTQVMTGSTTAFRNLTINNTSLTIPADITVNYVLTFTAGTIITNAYNVIIPNTGSVNRTSGHVAGNFRKYVATGTNVSRSFEIGSGTNYTPLSIVFTSVGTAGNLTVSSTASDHPSIATSGFNTALTINRYWTLTNTSIVYTNYSVTANFVDADKDAGYNTSYSIIKLYDGSAWSTTNSGTQSSNSSQALMVTSPVSAGTAALQIGEIVSSSTDSLYSIKSGNWSTSGTWSQTSGGPSCSCVPTSLDNVVIENQDTIVMDGNSGVARSLTIKTGGIANWTSTRTTNIGTGGINITSTGDITGALAGVLTTSGGLILNKVLTSTSVTLTTTGTAGQIINGTGSLANLDISINTTNIGNITVTNRILSTSASTLTQSSGAILTYNGTSAIAPSLDATAAGNAIIYGGATQTIKATTYNDLIISGSGTKTLAGNISVNGNLAINTGTLSTSTFQITGNAYGTFTMAANTAMNVGLNSSATNVLFPTNFTSGNITLASTSTVTYYGNNAQPISSIPTYGNLIIRTYSGSKAANGNLTVTGTLTTMSPAILDLSSYNLDVTGSYTNNGSLTFTSGTFNITGSFSNTGTFTCGTGTVNYRGNSAQTIRGINYYNLTFSGTGTKTLQAAATIGIAGNFTRGSMTVTPGATNSVHFTGSTQIMTGNATTFTNLTLANTSLTIAADITVNTVLTLTSGNLITNAGNVIIPASGSVSRTSGFIVGNLRKNVSTGSNISRTFELGTNSDYAPLTIVFSTVSSAGNLTVSTTASDHPAIAASGFALSYTVNRYWTLTNAAIIYTNYTVTPTFVNTDKDPDYNTANSVIKVYNGSLWTTPVAGTPTANTAQATTVTIPVSPNTVSIQIGDGDPTILGNLYSIANGSWNTLGTWAQSSGGASCNCIPSAMTDVIIENNHIVTMNGDSANSLTIQSGGVANWTSASTTHIGSGGININTSGNITGTSAGILTTSGGLILNSTLTSTSVTIKTMTTPDKTITGTGTLANLEINTNTTNQGNISLTHVLSITGGTFTNSGGTFTLKANAARYARIAPVCGSCGFSGNFTIENYIPARATITWSNLSSPVSNSTMADWDNELFLEYPFSGWDHVNNRPAGSNVLAYDEPSANYYQISASTPLGTGKGFEIGLTNNATLDGFSATTLTTTGVPHYGTINIPLQFTGANGPAYPIGYSGENLVGNPFASAITVNGMNFTNTLSSIDVYDHTIDNYRTLTGSDILPPYQGFWAYAQGNGALITVPETAKSATDNATLYRTNNVPEFLNLTLASGDASHNMAFTLKVACNETAQDGWDEQDHPYRKSLNARAPSLTATVENTPLSISTFNSNHDVYKMPVNMQVGINGHYKITASGINSVADKYASILLEDTFTHTFIDLNKSTVYTFNAKVSDSKQRFVLYFSKATDYKPTTTATISTDNVSIIKTATGNQIGFNLTQTENTIIGVVDLLGRSIMDNIIIQANNQNIDIALPDSFHGYYMIVVQSTHLKTVKKFVQP